MGHQKETKKARRTSRPRTKGSHRTSTEGTPLLASPNTRGHSLSPPRALETHSPDSIPALDTQQPVTQWTCGPCCLTALQVRRLGAGFLSPDMTDIRGQAVNYSVWGHHAS